MTSQSVEASSLATSQGSLTREGPTLLSVEEARSRIIDAIRPLNAMRIELGSALGRALAEDIVASRPHPPAAVAAMDGYALRCADVLSLPVRLKKIGISRAGARFGEKVSVGGCVRIFTGAILPDGADTIALQEDASEHGDTVKITHVPEPGRHIRAAGSNYSAGQLCLAQGRVLTARDIGVIASCGPCSGTPQAPRRHLGDMNWSILVGHRGLTKFSAQTTRRLSLLLRPGAVSRWISA